MKQATLVTVGGFLGAGKTTLLIAAARLLAARGLRAVLLANDQGEELVDTRWAEQAGVTSGGVTGGCFCCRFSEFLGAARRLLAEHEPDVLLAEPVGSCIDITATVLRPLERDFRGLFRLAPFTVLVDPGRASRLLAPGADPRLAFLFRSQIEEADLVCWSKCDLYATLPPLAHPAVRRLSAATGQGVAAWLDEVLSGMAPVASRLLEVDYAYYAQAEAELGWLNWSGSIRLRKPLPPSLIVGPLVDELDAALTAAGAAIVHLKVLDHSLTGTLKVSLCENGQEPAIDGDLTASATLHHELLINLRAVASPEALRGITEQALARLPGRINVRTFQCFRPSPPQPERRLPL